MFSKFNSKNKYNNNEQSDIDKKISNRLKNENSNPIESSIVNKINNLNLSANANNRLYGGYYNASNKVAKKVDLNEFVSIINEIFSTKDDVSEVRNGMECGIGVKNYNDVRTGDVIEVFEIIEIQRTIA